MLKEVYESYNELGSRLREAVVLKKAGFFLTEDLLLIPVPNWEGWEQIGPHICESINHFAHWEFFFHPRDANFWIFLRITWPSVTQILLGFVYPDDRRLLDEIALYHRLSLVDLPLLEGRPHPLSKGIMVNNIPTDLLGVFGIVSSHGKKSIQQTNEVNLKS